MGVSAAGGVPPQPTGQANAVPKGTTAKMAESGRKLPKWQPQQILCQMCMPNWQQQISCQMLHKIFTNFPNFFSCIGRYLLYNQGNESERMMNQTMKIGHDGMYADYYMDGDTVVVVRVYRDSSLYPNVTVFDDPRWKTVAAGIIRGVRAGWMAVGKG